MEAVGQEILNEGGPAAIAFIITIALSLLVGLFVPAAGMAIIALGIFASVVIGHATGSGLG